MKKLAASILGICSMVAYVHAQGTFIIDSSANGGNGSSSSATTGGLVWLSDGTTATLDTGTDISLQLLWGTSAATVNNVLNMDPSGLNSPANTAWLANQGTGSGDITFNANGTIVDQNGINYILPGVAAGSTVFMQFQGWTGNASSYANATGAGVYRGTGGVFSITAGLNTSPIQPDVSGMPALVLTVPEPSVLALSGIGAAALMLVRRKK